MLASFDSVFLFSLNYPFFKGIPFLPDPNTNPVDPWDSGHERGIKGYPDGQARKKNLPTLTGPTVVLTEHPSAQYFSRTQSPSRFCDAKLTQQVDSFARFHPHSVNMIK